MNQDNKIPYATTGIISYTWYSEKHPLYNTRKEHCISEEIFNKLENYDYKNEYKARYKTEEAAMKSFLNAKKELHG